MKKLIALGLLTALSFSVAPGQGQVLAAPQQKTLYQQDNSSSVRQNVINSGMKYLGTPYEFGSSRSNTNTFDCSDFVRQAYWEGSGVLIPANSRTQGAYIKQNGTVTKDWRGLKPGDIMFFMSYKGNKDSSYRGIDKNKARITHNGIYLGNGKILHTYSKTSGGVRIDSIENTHWEKRFLFGGSFLR
ncbi:MULTISPECIES: C40 family peptidase [Paenibacillus]|uniref:C40 family peptidase n=1 Tax=Paenibacillus TaxID=44249 RepID=UPI0010CF91E7|nr:MULTISPECIES: C40 family peptidase [Paenibacillus]VTR35579.1 NLP/P60 protein [Actinobacillus pleuropneumoniae]